MADTTELDATGRELYFSPEFQVLCRRFNIPYGHPPSSFKLEFANHGTVKVTQEIPKDPRRPEPDQPEQELQDEPEQPSPQRKVRQRGKLPRDNHEPDPREQQSSDDYHKQMRDQEVKGGEH